MDKYTDLLNEFQALFEEMILLEENKRDTVIAHDLLKLEEIMKREQAGIMKIRGMEQRRLRMQEELGLGNMPFRQILAEVPQETRLLLTPVYRKLETTIARFKITNESTSQVIETALHKLDGKLNQYPLSTSGITSRTV